MCVFVCVCVCICNVCEKPAEHLWYDILRTRKEGLLARMSKIKNSPQIKEYGNITDNEKKPNFNSYMSVFVNFFCVFCLGFYFFILFFFFGAKQTHKCKLNTETKKKKKTRQK